MHRLASIWFLNCCPASCCCKVPCNAVPREDLSKERMLQNNDPRGKMIDDSETKEQIELTGMQSRDWLMGNEVGTMPDDDSIMADVMGHKGPKESQEITSSFNCIDPGDKSYSSSATSGLAKRVDKTVPMVSKVDRAGTYTAYEERTDSESGCELPPLKEMFPKCRLKKTNRQKQFRLGSKNKASWFIHSLMINGNGR